MFMALARIAERRVGRFSPQALANTAWAFVEVDQLDTKLFRALVHLCARLTYKFEIELDVKLRSNWMSN